MSIIARRLAPVRIDHKNSLTIELYCTEIHFLSRVNIRLILSSEGGYFRVWKGSATGFFETTIIHSALAAIKHGLDQ